MSRQIWTVILAFGVTLRGALGFEPVAMAVGDGTRPVGAH